MHRMGQRLFVVGLVFALFFSFPFSAPADEPLVAKTLDRDADPVIVSGASMPEFLSVPLDQLFVYAYQEGQWQQIPWQFDEVKNLEYVASDNGLLDGVDELVVMGMDCGDRAESHQWISDASARSHSRYEIKVVDPLDTSKLGWVYVYRSSTLTETVTEDYVDYDFDTSIFTTPTYRLGFFVKYLAGNRLELNSSGINVLDRSKLRFKVPGQHEWTEEFGESDDPQPKILDGRVRAIAGYQELGQGILTIGYRSQFYDQFTIDFSWSPLPFEWVRLSADFNENIVGGTYYDANTPSGVPVDGSPDTITISPAAQWQQISDDTGTIIHAADASAMQGTQSTYYKDDATVDPTDTGDKKSYGDMGMTITNPIKAIDVKLTHYILPSNQPNVGSTYYDYFIHPLQFQATEQSFSTQPTATPTPSERVFLPVIVRN